MIRLNHHDKSWQALLDDWSDLCREYDEDFGAYMPFTLDTLAQQCEDCFADKRSGVYAYKDSAGKHTAVCFLNSSFIPKFSGRVLRVRHLILAPNYDLGEYSVDQYAEVLSKVVAEVIVMSDGALLSDHLKFHFRSPADVEVFRQFAPILNDTKHFEKVTMQGSWLTITKN